ncbi:MAG TPA: sulfotransferase domain-containing protein [Candidatus Sulfotelmatobacter sp.]|nr:sulfotransferase domain-containing protein [Candidatus Sulfotelmatobacter sp.]
MLRRGIKHLSRVTDVLFRTLRIERDITIFPDDVFLTSYPRSGNTWTRFLVGNLVHHEEPVTFLNVERLVPDMYKHADRTLRNLPRPRIMKSHECFDPRYKRVIYVVRDPRDVAVSNFHWEMKQRAMKDDYPIDEFVRRWMEPIQWPRLGSWGEHVASWLTTRQGRPGFLILRYEDMLAHPEKELEKVARLLDIDPVPERLKRAADLSSADRMRKLEKDQGAKWVQTRDTRQDKQFVRKASSGDWRTKLPASSVQIIEAEWGEIMRSLGYKLSTEMEDVSVGPSHEHR